MLPLGVAKLLKDWECDDGVEVMMKMLMSDLFFERKKERATRKEEVKQVVECGLLTRKRVDCVFFCM